MITYKELLINNLVISTRTEILKEKRGRVFQMSETLEKKIQHMMPLLNEKQLRRYLGSEGSGFSPLFFMSVIF
jgi:hypothetical protein